MDSSLRALSTIQLFSDFDQRSLEEILDGSLTRSFPAEVIVLWENEPSPGIHLVRSGWLWAVGALYVLLTRFAIQSVRPSGKNANAKRFYEYNF